MDARAVFELISLIINEFGAGLATFQPLFASGVGFFSLIAVAGSVGIFITKIVKFVNDVQAKAKAEEEAKEKEDNSDKDDKDDKAKPMTNQQKAGVASTISDYVKALLLIGTSITALVVLNYSSGVCAMNGLSCQFYAQSNIACDISECLVALNSTSEGTPLALNETMCLLTYQFRGRIGVPHCYLYNYTQQLDSSCSASSCSRIYRFSLS